MNATDCLPQTWDELLQDPNLTLVFPDLAAMDMAGDFSAP